MEVSTKENKQKVVLPFLIAGILFAVGIIFYALYLRDFLALAIRYDLLKWGDLTETALDVLVNLSLAVFSIMIAFNKKHIKLLTIPAFVGAGLALFNVVSTLVTYGYEPANAYYLFRNLAAALAFAFLGVYTLKKGIAIVYASIFAFASTAVALWFNLVQLIYLIKQSAGLQTMYSYLLIMIFEVALLIIVWTLCIKCPKKLDNKDIIKKNIALAIFVSIITLGIYAVIWVKSISDDISKLENKESNSSLETALFFTIPFYCLFWFYKEGKKLSVLADDADMSWLYVGQGFFLLGLFSLGLMQGQLHRAIGLHR